LRARGDGYESGFSPIRKRNLTLKGFGWKLVPEVTIGGNERAPAAFIEIPIKQHA
jgi:hypothetical protein